MRTLVVGGIHPNERHALEIWYGLEKEICHKNVEFYKFPFEKTNFGQAVEALKIILNEKRFERRLSRIDEIYRDLVRCWANYVKKNISTRGKYSSVLENISLGDGIDWWGIIEMVLPEIRKSYRYASDYYPHLKRMLKKRNADIIVDLHNSHRDDKFGFEPHIIQYPPYLSSILQKYPHYPNTQEEKSVVVEIPAESVEINFAKYIALDIYPFEFFDPRLPLNKENYENQKEKVKSLILELAEHKVQRQLSLLHFLR
jgi:hypothetical protein